MKVSNYIKITQSVDPGPNGVLMLCSVCMERPSRSAEGDESSVQYLALTKTYVAQIAEDLAVGKCEKCDTVFLCRVPQP